MESMAAYPVSPAASLPKVPTDETKVRENPETS